MGRDLAENSPVASAVFDEVSQATGVDVRALCWESSEDVLRETQNAQLALFTCGVAAWKALVGRFPELVRATAGHSVGEYSALIAAEALTVSEGAKLVQIRGQVMARAGQVTPGTMAAVLGLERNQLQTACDEADGVVAIANDNCPGQLVISGEREAVEEAGKRALAAGAKRVLPLNVSGAFHSPLMSEAAQEMGKALAVVRFSTPRLTIYSNVTSKPAMSPDEWPSLLERQLLFPVRWTESIQNMIGDGGATFIECGGGEVLSGLIKRIDKSVATSRVSDMASLLEITG
jgi:[acyl-carrier-protein] S-malonyltransferase